MRNSQATNFVSWDGNFCFSEASISCGFYGKFLGNEFHFVAEGHGNIRYNKWNVDKCYGN